MSKLIYAKSKAAFETAYTAADRLSTGSIYRSIAFLEDGYLWTHGQYFRFFDSADPFTVTYAAGASVNSGNIVSLKDSLGTLLTTFDVGVTAITGDAVITSAAINQGTIALSHALRAAGADADITNTVGTNKSAINIPTLTINKYGHVTAMSSVATAVDQIKASVAGTTYYLLGHTDSAVGTAEAVKLSTVNVTNAGYLSAVKFIGNLNYSLTATLNGTANTFNNSAATSISFYAPTTAGTAGQLLKSNGTGSAPTWIDTITSISSGSTDSQIPTAKAVYNAVISGISTGDAMVYKGVLDATSNGLPAADKGDTYKVSVAGTFNGTKQLEVGDMLICNADSTAAVAYGNIVAATWNNWDIIQTNLITSTVGLNLLNLTNPSLLSFLRINADNSVSTRSATELKMDLSLDHVENTALSEWTGANTITTVGTIGTGTWNANTIAVNKGGTGLTSYAVGDLIYASGATTLARLADVAVGSILKSGGVGAAPTWGTLSGSDITGADLTKGADDTNITITLGGTPSGALLKAASITVGWTGVLAGARGGTGQSSYAAGDLLYAASAGSTLSKLAKGSDGQVLKLSGGVPTWGSDNDTHWTSNLIVGASSSATANAAATNSNVWLNFIENSTIRNTHNIVGTGATSVTSDAAGKITIDSLNTWRNVSAYKLSAATTLAEILNTTIGGLDLQFGSEFLWDDTNNELKLGWAEVDAVGAVTYAL